MRVHGVARRSIRPLDEDHAVEIIDQTALPHAFSLLRLNSVGDVAQAIRLMQVRGAPLIGVAAAYGVALALRENAGDATLARALAMLAATRPTAVNLHWALARQRALLERLPEEQRAEAAWREAAAIADEDVEQCRMIGQAGLDRLLDSRREGRRLEILTHCNAGWLATVDRGTALAPVYAAVDAGIEVHVWVSETRPRNQGLLTAWELAEQGVPHTLIADNAAGWLLASGTVDAVIVGADRVAANGDVANKVGTWLKALAANAAGVPFLVAAPRSTIDFACRDGAGIPIEARSAEELLILPGVAPDGHPAAVRLVAGDVAVANPAFDVTPAGLISALITERGCCPATREGLLELYPEEASG